MFCNGNSNDLFFSQLKSEYFYYIRGIYSLHNVSLDNRKNRKRS